MNKWLWLVVCGCWGEKLTLSSSVFVGEGLLAEEVTTPAKHTADKQARASGTQARAFINAAPDDQKAAYELGMLLIAALDLEDTYVLADTNLMSSLIDSARPSCDAEPIEARVIDHTPLTLERKPPPQSLYALYMLRFRPCDGDRNRVHELYLTVGGAHSRLNTNLRQTVTKSGGKIKLVPAFPLRLRVVTEDAADFPFAVVSGETRTYNSLGTRAKRGIVTLVFASPARADGERYAKLHVKAVTTSKLMKQLKRENDIGLLASLKDRQEVNIDVVTKLVAKGGMRALIVRGSNQDFQSNEFATATRYIALLAATYGVPVVWVLEPNDHVRDIGNACANAMSLLAAQLGVLLETFGAAERKAGRDRDPQSSFGVARRVLPLFDSVNMRHPTFLRAKDDATLWDKVAAHLHAQGVFPLPTQLVFIDLARNPQTFPPQHVIHVKENLKAPLREALKEMTALRKDDPNSFQWIRFTDVNEPNQRTTAQLQVDRSNRNDLIRTLKLQRNVMSVDSVDLSKLRGPRPKLPYFWSTNAYNYLRQSLALAAAKWYVGLTLQPNPDVDAAEAGLNLERQSGRRASVHGAALLKSAGLQFSDNELSV